MEIPAGKRLTLEDARGRLLAMRVAEHIEEHPEDYDQSVWGGACGTPACVAGWAVRLTGVTEDEFTRLVQQDEIVGAAAGVLRLDWSDASWLFDAARTPGAMPAVLRHYATTGTLDWGVEDEWLDERRRVCLWGDGAPMPATAQWVEVWQVVGAFAMLEGLSESDPRRALAARWIEVQAGVAVPA